MGTRDKLLGREDLWRGDPWMDIGRGPKLPGPQFWVGLVLGALLVWVLL